MTRNLLSKLLAFACFAIRFNHSYILSIVDDKRALKRLVISQSKYELDKEGVWSVRRNIIRKLIAPMAEDYNRNKINPQKDKIKLEGDKLQFIVTGLLLAVGVLIFRYGGRLAFIKFIGLDFMTDSSINQQLNDFLVTFNNLGNFKYLSFLLAWMLVKIFCIDPLTIVLALSSGILFGGVWQVHI